MCYTYYQKIIFTKGDTVKVAFPALLYSTLDPFDTTTSEMFFKVKTNYFVDEVLFECSEADFLTGDEFGNVEINIPSSVTYDFDWNQGVYKLSLDNGIMIAAGEVEIRESIAKV